MVKTRTRQPWVRARAVMAALLFGALASGVGCSSSDGGSGGAGTKCTTDADCAMGDKCEGSKCVKPTGAACTSSVDCPGGTCQIDSIDANGATQGKCATDDKPRGPGQFGTMCPNGDECDAASGFVCEGAGAGDLSAYCTLEPCTSDSDCPTDFRCLVQGANKPPCEAACGIAPRPGTPGVDCVPAADIGDGKAYTCGTLDVLRHYCAKRTFCDECQTSSDCVGIAGQVCAKDSGGNKICTLPCQVGTDSCPWGNASVCGNFDADLGFATCSHRFGSCKGTGNNCEPCRTDSDCGTNAACILAPFTKEQFCVDLSASCSCEGLPVESGNTACTGGGCPKTPGGLDMTCFGGSASVGYPVYQKCFGANSSGSASGSQLGCWPPP